MALKDLMSAGLEQSDGFTFEVEGYLLGVSQAKNPNKDGTFNYWATVQQDKNVQRFFVDKDMISFFDMYAPGDLVRFKCEVARGAFTKFCGFLE